MPAITTNPNITQNFGAKGSRAEVTVKIAAAGSRILRGPYKAFRKTTKTPLNMVAMLSAVGIQEASSKPRPSAPRRSTSPTLIKRAFSVAIPAPRNTPTIPTYGLVVSWDRPDCEGRGAGWDAEAVTRASPSIARAICANGCDHG